MNIKNIFKHNKNKWVATDTGYKNVFASSSKLDVLQKKLKELRVKDAVVLFVPPFDRTLAPRFKLI